MARKSIQIYTIKLSDWIFHDPKFSKKSSSYVAISNAFLNSKMTECLSLGEFKLMISFIQEATKLGKSTIKVDSKYIRSQGKVMEKSLLKLNDFGYLEYTVSKIESKIESSSNIPTTTVIENKETETSSVLIKKETLSDSLPSLPKKENYSHWFEKFVIEEVGSLDTGQTRKAVIVQRAFSSEEGFLSWANSVAATKTFKSLKTEERQRYFFKALDSELKSRGVV